MWKRILLLAPALTLNLHGQRNPDWTTNHPPFRIAGNLYYVGSKDLAAYLVVTPEGDILINSNLTTSAPQIEHNVEALGFRFTDIKILLISHAHFDHAAGSAGILRRTRAQYEVMEGDAAVVESGGRADFFYPHSRYPAAKVDRVLHDGDEVRLGGMVLVAHRTAGHTKGCTTWTMKVIDGGRALNAVIVGSPNVLRGYRLFDDPKYSRMELDFAQTFRTLRALPCDLFLGSHGSYFGMEEKYVRLSAGGANPFLDHDGYRRFVAEHEELFRVEMARQSASRKSSILRPAR